MSTSKTKSTTDTTVEPAGRPPEWVLKLLNPLLRIVLRSPLHFLVSKHLILITVTGRKTGKEYTFPVGYEKENGTVHVISHSTNWWKNLRGGGQEVTIYLRGNRRKGHAEVEERDKVVAKHIHDYLKRKGTGAARRVGLDISGDEVPSKERLAKVVDHVVVVTIDLESD